MVGIPGLYNGLSTSSPHLPLLKIKFTFLFLSGSRSIFQNYAANLLIKSDLHNLVTSFTCENLAYEKKFANFCLQNLPLKQVQFTLA